MQLQKTQIEVKDIHPVALSEDSDRMKDIHPAALSEAIKVMTDKNTEKILRVARWL